MPFIEVLSSVVLTYASSEYLYGAKRRAVHAMWMVIALQLIEAMFQLQFNVKILNFTLNLPMKILVVSGSFCCALWVDCTRSLNQVIPLKEFMLEVWNGCLYLLPVYIVLAVFISFVFMLISDVFEFFSLPTKILNWPIYYGTLYGPFVVVYHKVKKAFSSKTLLPLK